MLTLYFKPTCAFCHRVIQIAENLKIEMELKDISEDEVALSELLEKGGLNQVPFLIDSTKEVSMYESSDIIDYLRENYSQAKMQTVSPVKPRVHISSSVCESCEG